MNWSLIMMAFAYCVIHKPGLWDWRSSRTMDHPARVPGRHSLRTGSDAGKYNDKWGVVDQNGQFVMPATFDLPPTILGGVIAAYSSQSGWMAFALTQS